MTNQTESPDGEPRKDTVRPSPDVHRHDPDGQASGAKKGQSAEQAASSVAPASTEEPANESRPPLGN